MIPIADESRRAHEGWLLDLTQIPTAAGREFRVIRWIKHWLASRADLVLTEDLYGNLHVASRGAGGGGGQPVYFTAHLDHPAFVVERVVAPGVLELTFRGGVMDEYFADAEIVVHDSADRRHAATITGKMQLAEGQPKPVLARWMAEVVNGDGEEIRPGDVATWDLPPAEITDGLIHTAACDDLAAAAAALAAFDVLRTAQGPGPRDVRLLFTRAEEVGFVGAIGACRPEPAQRLMPMNSRVIALENSRSFAESPIGGGPIVRVGDRISVFSPTLTDAVAKRAEQIAGGASTVTASQKLSELPSWKWQRKLMAGGACEASVFCAAGYEATCVCLPLGNYHNMADLAAVQAGTNTSRARVGREFVSVSDFHGMVDLLVACGLELPAGNPFASKLDKIWGDLSFVLETPRA